MIKYLLALFIVTPVFASKGGGGGVGIACYKGEELVSVELLDIYEARVNNLRLMKDLSGDFEKDAKKISKKIYKTEKNAERVLEISRNYKIIPADAELLFTNDAFPISIPRDCVFKQIANYYNDKTIYLDKVLFNKMSYTSQLALAFHEYIYAEERRLGVPDSRYTRTIVGLAFSDENPFMEISMKGHTHICKSDDEKVIFSAVKYSPKGNVWKFNFLFLNGHRIFSQKYGYYAVADVTSLGDYRSENPYGARDEIDTYASQLTSKINGDERLKALSNQKTISLTWDGSDPGDRFENVSVTCQALEQ